MALGSRAGNGVTSGAGGANYVRPFAYPIPAAPSIPPVVRPTPTAFPIGPRGGPPIASDPLTPTAAPTDDCGCGGSSAAAAPGVTGAPTAASGATTAGNAAAGTVGASGIPGVDVVNPTGVTIAGATLPWWLLLFVAAGVAFTEGDS